MRMGAILGVVVLCGSLTACVSESEEPAATSETEETAEAIPEPVEPGVVKVKAEDYSFTAPPTFPSGWVKLRFENQGSEPHFMLIWDLPEGKTFDDYASEVAEVFQEHYSRYQAGEVDQATFFEELIAAIPEWFQTGVTPMGGPGFTAPGDTSETMIYLEPGDNYVLECYIRSMKQGDRFHGSEGMLRPLIVTDETSPLEPPQPDIEIAVSNTGLTVEGDPTPGRHIVKVRIDENPENIVRNNVHLVRLAEGQTAADVAPWLNWVDALLPPAPAEFLGGAGQTVAGRESYVTVDLTPGHYAWISEMHGPQGLVHEFTVE